MYRYGNSPKRVVTPEMEFLSEQADKLNAILEEYRGPNRRRLNDRMRNIYRVATNLWKRYHEIDNAINKEYHEYWKS
jgi:hypothetical protein